MPINDFKLRRFIKSRLEKNKNGEKMVSCKSNSNDVGTFNKFIIDSLYCIREHIEQQKRFHSFMYSKIGSIVHTVRAYDV